MYDVLLADLAARYDTYLQKADPLLDEPSVRVIGRIVADFPRLASDRAAVLGERAELAAPPRSTNGLGAIAQMVEFRPAADAAAPEAP
jgi:phosphatidylserine/phosphatidylglycerophosphate/cardiolipin synthase-like enzyme